MLTDQLDAIILGIIEGVTEFLPISSTAHMVILSDFFQFAKTSSLFEVVVQLSALCAILCIYFQRLFQITVGLLTLDKTAWRFIRNLFFAFLPFGIIGALAHEIILDILLENPYISASAMLLGGIVLLWVDRSSHFLPKATPNSEEEYQKELNDLTVTQSLLIGLCQSLAIIPGVSRSGASIVGGMWIGLTKKSSAEFSFFLAIPTMLGASVVALWAKQDDLTDESLTFLMVGCAVSFLSAYVVVKFFLYLIDKIGFSAFGWYRILFGFLVLLYLGVS